MKPARLALFLSVVLLVFFSCNEPTSIGSDIIDDELTLQTAAVDTFSIIASTKEERALITTSIVTRPYHLLGQMNDPVFGETTAGIYSQIRLIQNSLILGEELSLDSVVLTLDYLGNEAYYGDLEAPISLEVYEVNQNMVRDSTYTSDEEFELGGLLGSLNDVFLRPADSLVMSVDTIKDQNGLDSVFVQNKLAPHLRFRLDDEFGQRLLDQSGTANFANNDAFLEFFKGLYVVPVGGTGNAVAYFDMNSFLSKVTLYYKEAEDIDPNINNAVDFRINANASVINRFEHDYTGSEVEPVLNSPLPNGNDVLYLQGLSGLNAVLEFPYLSDLDTVAINEAHLDIYRVVDASSDVYDAPIRLDFYLKDLDDTESTFTYTQDHGQLVDGDTTDISGQLIYKYELPVSYYVQQYLLGEHRDLEFNITLDYYDLSGNIVLTGLLPYRTKITGPDHPDYPMKLNLVYSELE